MGVWSLSKTLSSSSDVWKEWELRGVVFLSLALQIILICLGNRRKYLPHAWIQWVTWSAYQLADSVALFGLGMIFSMIREIKAGKSLSNPQTELSTFWVPFLLLHLGGPDTISAFAIEDNELWLRHLLTLVTQAGLTVYVLVMAWSHPTLKSLAILVLLSGFYKYGERVWVLRTAGQEYFKDSFPESQPHRKDSGKIKVECDLKEQQGYRVVPHHVIDIDNEGAVMLDVIIAEFFSKELSSKKDLEVQEYKRVVGTLLSASHLVNTSKHLFTNHWFSMEERDNLLSILSSKHCAGDFKVIEIELGLIFDIFYSKANAVCTSWGFICRLTILLSICVALVLFSFTDKQLYSKLDVFLTFLLLGAAIFIELYALAYVLFSDQVACWLIKKKQSAFFCFIDRIKPLLKRRRWSNIMCQYNLMSLRNNSCWWRFLKLLHVDEMVVKFLYLGHVGLTKDIKDLIVLKIKEKEAIDVQELHYRYGGWGYPALSLHRLKDKLEWSIKLDFDMSILVWHIATELCYHLDYGWPDSTKELERNNQGPVKKKCLMGLHLSRYMLYLQYMCPSMLPAKRGGIKFRDIYKEPGKRFTKAPLLDQIKDLAKKSVLEEDKVDYVFSKGCRVALELEGISRWWRWEVIREVWVEMLIDVAPMCKGRDHARQMPWGGELITHVWFLMAHYGLTENFRRPHPKATAEIIVNPI